jgi:hypothetical protein
MAIAKAAVTVLAPVLVPAGGTKVAPMPAGLGGTIPCSAYYGGELTYKITNGSSAPGQPLWLTFQVSHDGANWYDYQTVSGDVIASGAPASGSILLDRGVMNVRVLAYNNTTNGVNVEVFLQAVTAL